MQTREPNHSIKIVKIATYKRGLTQDEALARAKELGLRLLTNNEVDELLNGKGQGWKQYEECFPCWTGTHADYNDDECTITENGKSEEIKLPKENGWYLKDKYAIPSEGKQLDLPTPKENFTEELNFKFDAHPKARWLTRLAKNSCLIVRDCKIYIDCEFYDYTGPMEFTRDVLLTYEPKNRLGVFGTPLKRI